MKIEKITLKNFAAFYNAMEAKEVSIDFSSAKNKVCLIIGKNGSGKTSLLSVLNPFADLGNLDVRNNQPLILKDKEGYKEIVISRAGSIYVIKHIYSPHKDKSHSVKSYIEKDGLELNPNGNVRSFLEVVKRELSIEPEYLKLVRLGSNVTSIIGLTETERKNFMSKIMSDIDVYVDYYKIVGNKERQIKDNISHIANKLSKLGISDILIADKEIKDLGDDIKSLSDIMTSLNSEIAIANHDIDNIDDNENLRDNLNNSTKMIAKMKETLLKYKPDKIDSDHYKKAIDKGEKAITKLEAEISSLSIILESELSNLNSLMDQYNTVNNQYIKELESDKTIKQMEENLNDIRKSLRESEDVLGDFKTTITLEDLQEFISFIKTIQVQLNTTYEFGTKAINKVLKLMSDNEDVEKYINSHLIDIDESKNDNMSLFFAKIAKSIMFDDKTVIQCKSECEAKKLFNMIRDLMNDRNISDKSNDASFYEDMSRVYQNITTIFKSLEDRSVFISMLPDDVESMFTKDEVIKHIKKLEIFYDEKKINNLLSLITENNRYKENLSKYEKEDELLRKFKSISNLEAIKEQKDSLKEDLDNKDKYIKDIKEKISKDNEKLTEERLSLDTNTDIFEALTKYDTMVKENEKYKEDYEIYKTNKEKIHDLTIKLNGVINEYERKTNNLNQLKMNYDQYKILMKELESYNHIYDEMDKVKESLSAKSGIPLYIIRKYLGDDTVETTNDLLNVVYDGQIELDDFEITPSSFSIPVYVRGFRMPDVKYTSQGELSFISIALSFALSSIVLARYNIMLLDEIDGPLDSDNREKFIKILEKQIDKIDSEQNFLITHNSMFSSYPVDIVDLSFGSSSEEYPLANFIKVERR